ncbi:hypothetical protein GDO81_012763 [Engystomops pustulosus]|uniref:3'-5' exonuclease domain-containing protein n=1 Tax=Engystomops pustulosus TaxID=76066 RepID=A0AAV7AZF9_ENGPU|nr:hypothetical protein GDO81_012763 [Engystomops pustulosus]
MGQIYLPGPFAIQRRVLCGGFGSSGDSLRYFLRRPPDVAAALKFPRGPPECTSLYLVKDGQIVGVDMEWRPSFGGLGKPNVSLIQLAVREEVFLLDVLQGNLLRSSDSGGSSELVTFIKDLFSSSKIKKLGYGMVGDFQSLDATDARFRGLELHNVFDLCEVHKQIQRSRSRPRVSSGRVDVLEDTSKDNGIRQPEKGLSLLVKDVLGKPLDKKEQLSNWDKRPLREDQIIYAAADAYCLLDVFETLFHAPEKFGLKPNFCELSKGKTSPKKEAARSPHPKESTPNNKRMKTPPPKVTPPKASPHTKPLSPREFSVICDNMLQGLGRYLRCLGVDVLMLENDDDHRKAAEIARRDGRVILTCGLPYQTLRSQIGEGRCFSVNCSERAKEQAIRVLKHFNVSVALSDVFSRCQKHVQSSLHCTKLARKIAPQSPIYRIINKFKERGSIVTKKAPGRPRRTSKRQDRLLKVFHPRDGAPSSAELAQEWQQAGVSVSEPTVRLRRLLEQGLVTGGQTKTNKL